jgi:hypothetical protein
MRCGGKDQWLYLDSSSCFLQGSNNSSAHSDPNLLRINRVSCIKARKNVKYSLYFYVRNKDATARENSIYSAYILASWAIATIYIYLSNLQLFAIVTSRIALYMVVGWPYFEEKPTRNRVGGVLLNSSGTGMLCLWCLSWRRLLSFMDIYLLWTLEKFLF